MIFNIQKIIENLSLKLGLRFERINSPNIKNINKIKESDVRSIQQAQIINNNSSNNDNVSDREMFVMIYLYKIYKTTSTNNPVPAQIVHREVGFTEDTDLSVLHDSLYVEIISEEYKLKPQGIRFMDSFIRLNKPEIDITSLAHSGGPDGQELTGLRLVNNGSGSAIDIKCFLCADGLECVNFANIERLNPNEESRNSLGYRYSDISFFTQPLNNLRVVFEYKNRNGFKFTSGRYLTQTQRADGNYNINSSPLGDYFEM